MAFMNTVETVGDAALTNSIIDRSITELNCNITTSLGERALCGCSALKSVNFPNVTSVANYAFYGCTALEKADFSAVVNFTDASFLQCTGLTALILRSTDAVCTIAGTPFSSSAIASGTGYIYVPRALVDTYKAARGWSTYASQIRAIEDYPGIADAYSWAGVAENIANGSYASVYKVGDMVPLDLGSEGIIDMEIVAFGVDDLADGSGKAPITWIGKELLKTKHRMNPAHTPGTIGTGALGGWEHCEMRTYLKGTIKPMIPTDIQAMIKEVNKYSTGYTDDTTITKTALTTDDVWIPSFQEVFGAGYESGNTQYSDAFQSNADRKKCITGTATATHWHLRTMTGHTYTAAIDAYGSAATGYISNAEGIALGFCT